MRESQMNDLTSTHSSMWMGASTATPLSKFKQQSSSAQKMSRTIVGKELAKM